MIPKIIHYCWFGLGPISDLEIDCIESWKKLLPDFQIKRWDENNFDYNQYRFSKDAYFFKKFAFVSDVCRISVLYNEGGIYLDTDMLLLKPFTNFLDYDVFLGEEKEGQLSAGVIGIRPNNDKLKPILDYYLNNHFFPDRPITIPYLLGGLLERQGLAIFSEKYFYPLPYSKRNLSFEDFLEPETVAVHLWNHSWKSEFGYLSEGKYWKSLNVFFENIKNNPNEFFSASYLIKYFKFFIARLLPFLVR